MIYFIYFFSFILFFLQIRMGDCTNLVANECGAGWLVGYFGFNGPLRQYFSLYRAVSQREGEREERIEDILTRNR